MKRALLAFTMTGMLAGGGMTYASAQAAPKDDPVVPAASFTPEAIKWKACGIPDLDDVGGQCGLLTVPLDYGNPQGTKIKLAVSRIKHTVAENAYQGVMLTNPGGPGSSGLTLPTVSQAVPSNAGAAYDWIGFDPRGVGLSVPTLSCDGNYFKAPRPEYVPTTAKLETTWLNRSKKYAEACGTAGGALLDHVKTIDTVNDLESIRKALGRSQINYYGFSYGSYLGQVYSTLHPAQVRRMVLDGIVDPRGVWYKDNLDQDVAFEHATTEFFAWVATNSGTYALGTTEAQVEAKYYAALSALGKKPAGGQLGADEWNDVFVSAGYNVLDWPGIAAAFAGYVHTGDYKPILAAYQDENPTGKAADNEFAMYEATQCTDAAWPKNWNTWRTDNWATHANAPFITWNNAWYNAPCLTWPAASGRPVTVNGAASPAMLMLNETFDAATPFEGALEVRSRFPASVLVEGVGGTSHAASLYGVACTDNLIAAYLSGGSLPARVAGRQSDVKCDPLTAPDPTTAESPALTVASADALSRESRHPTRKHLGLR